MTHGVSESYYRFSMIKHYNLYSRCMHFFQRFCVLLEPENKFNKNSVFHFLNLFSGPNQWIYISIVYLKMFLRKETKHIIHMSLVKIWGHQLWSFSISNDYDEVCKWHPLSSISTETLSWGLPDTTGGDRGDTPRSHRVIPPLTLYGSNFCLRK